MACHSGLARGMNWLLCNDDFFFFTFKNSSAALCRLRGKLESEPSAPFGVTVTVASLRSIVSSSLAPVSRAAQHDVM